jgi:hypothetical protein
MLLFMSVNYHENKMVYANAVHFSNAVVSWAGRQFGALVVPQLAVN